MVSLHRLFGMLRNPRPYRERITADKIKEKSKISPNCLWQLLLSAERYMKYFAKLECEDYEKIKG